MTIQTGTYTEPQTQFCPSSEVGRNIDQNGNRPTLGEMIHMEGLFPLEEIVDRLPFRLLTLRKWAKKGPFTACFKRVHTGSGGNNSLLLIDLSLFASRFEELATLAREQDATRVVPRDQAMEDTSGLDEFAEWVFRAKRI